MATYSTEPGFINRNGQLVIRETDLAGTDHNQKVYQLGCSKCGFTYGANGSDIFQRLCPACQGGKAGFPCKDETFELQFRAFQRIADENKDVLAMLGKS
jgi:hypothetical protein